ncbi:MAG: YraN family protein [Minisyncoccota bacterium]
MPSQKRKFGDLGENVACMFLEKHGFRVIERNYLRKWGEIDIVAKRGRVVHFVEVKSQRVSSETFIRAEENMHPHKLRRLQRTVETYILEKGLDSDWQIDLVVVRIDEDKRVAKAEMLENII